MALIAPKIDLSKVNKKNFEDVKAFAVARLQSCDKLRDELKGMSKNLQAAQQDSSFTELESLVASLCKNVHQYLGESRKAVVEFAKTNTANQNDFKEVKDKVEGRGQSLSELTQQKDEGKKQYQQGIRELEKMARGINCSNLAAIEVDPQTKIHFDKVWIWCLDVLYDIPSTKYDWENFKRQAFKNDGGADFKKRMMGVNFNRMTQYQVDYSKRVAGLRPLLSREISSSDVNTVLSCIDQVIIASEGRIRYKNAVGKLGSNAKQLAMRKIEVDINKQISVVSKENLALSREVSAKFEQVYNQLGGSYSYAEPAIDYESEYIQSLQDNQIEFEAQADFRAPVVQQQEVQQQEILLEEEVVEEPVVFVERQVEEAVEKPVEFNIDERAPVEEPVQPLAAQETVGNAVIDEPQQTPPQEPQVKQEPIVTTQPPKETKLEEPQQATTDFSKRAEPTVDAPARRNLKMTKIEERVEPQGKERTGACGTDQCILI